MDGVGIAIRVTSADDVPRSINQRGMSNINAAAGVGENAGNDAVGFDLLRRQRGERHPILRARDFDDIVAHIAQSATGGALRNLINRLVQRASCLRITKGRNPRAIHADGVCGVAGTEPGAALVRTDAVADIGEPLKVGKVEAIL